MKKHPIRTVIYLSIALVPTVLAMFLIYWSIRQSLISSRLDELSAIAEVKTKSADTYFGNVREGLSLTMASFSLKSNLPNLIEFVGSPDNPTYVKSKSLLDPPLRALIGQNDIIDVELTDASGTVVYASNPTHTDDIGYPLADPMAFTEGTKGVYDGLIFPSNESDTPPVIFFESGPIRDANKNLLGVIAFEVDATTVEQLVGDTAGLGKTGETIIGGLVNATGTGSYALVLSPLRNNPASAFTLKIPIGSALEKPLQAAVMQEHGSGVATNYAGVPVLAAWQYMPSRQRGVVVQIDLSEVLGGVNTLGWFLIILSLIVTLAATITIFVLSKQPFDEFRLAVDNASEQIIITDPEATVLYANHATEAITGYPVAKIMNKKAGSLWHLPMPKAYYENLWKTIEIDKKSFVGELQNRRKNGEIYDAELKISPILDRKNNVILYVSIERDISEEKKTVRAKNEFMSLASHQLRTPPSIIGWYTETLKAGDLGPINEKQNEYLCEIYKANQRMVAIINSLLNISRIELNTFSISNKEIDIKGLVDETITELSSRFKRKADVKKDYDPNLNLFRADPNILQIIIDNLISNAFKYSPPDNTKIELAARLVDRSFLFSVKDNGIGIPAKDQDRVFEKLFRADNAVATDPDGTGIGLYMTKRIVESLGGKIWFESKENSGTTFFISLPAGMPEKIGTTTLARVAYYAES